MSIRIVRFLLVVGLGLLEQVQGLFLFPFCSIAYAEQNGWGKEGRLST